MKTKKIKMKLITKFKKLYKSEIAPKLKQKDKLNLEIDKLYNNLNSESNNLNSEGNKLLSEIDKLNSKINKLDSEILMIFYEFGKSNDCQVIWRGYGFKLKDIELKTYNKDQTGFIFFDMKGNEREELFEPKPDEYKVIDGHKYKLVEEIN